MFKLLLCILPTIIFISCDKESGQDCCKNCAGRGYICCTFCENGWKECAYCSYGLLWNGERYEKCNVCNGNYLTICTICNGKIEICSACNGYGKISDD